MFFSPVFCLRIFFSSWRGETIKRNDLEYARGKLRKNSPIFNQHKCNYIRFIIYYVKQNVVEGNKTYRIFFRVQIILWINKRGKNLSQIYHSLFFNFQIEVQRLILSPYLVENFSKNLSQFVYSFRRLILSSYLEENFSKNLSQLVYFSISK